MLLAAVSLVAGPLDAKTPGETHCYGEVCHRVYTLDETAALVGAPTTVVATYYDHPDVDRFNIGKYTSSGEEFDADDPTRASSSNLPDGTEVLVWNPSNGRAVHVRINDFGPFHTDRKLDLTRAAAERLGFLAKGVQTVRLVVISPPGKSEPRYRRGREYAPASGYLGILGQRHLPGLVRELMARSRKREQGPLPEGDHARQFARAVALRPWPAQRVLKPGRPAKPPKAEAASFAGLKLAALSRAAEPRSMDADGAVVVADAAGPRLSASRFSLTAADVSAPTADLEPIAIAAAVQPVTIADGASMREDAIALWLPGAAPPIDLAPSPVKVPASIEVASSAEATGAARGAGRTIAIAAIETDDFWWSVPGVETARRLIAAVQVRSHQAGVSAGLSLAVMLAVMLGATILYVRHQGLAPVRVPVPGGLSRLRHLRRPAGVRLSPRTATAPRAALAPHAIGHDGPLTVMPPAEPEPATDDARAISILGEGLLIEGHVVSRGALRVDGEIRGLCEANSIEVGPAGRVEGVIKASHVVVAGTVDGAIEAANVTLAPTAAVSGDIDYDTFAMAEGADVRGRLRNRKSRKQPAAERPPWANRLFGR